MQEKSRHHDFCSDFHILCFIKDTGTLYHFVPPEKKCVISICLWQWIWKLRHGYGWMTLWDLPLLGWTIHSIKFVGSWKGPFVLAGRDVGLAGDVVRHVPIEWCSGVCASHMRKLLGRMWRLPGVPWPQCGSWLAAWSWSADIGETACNRHASYPVSQVWPPASRGGQLPGELGMTTGGPRQPSLAQCSADDSEDRSLWTRRADRLVDAVAGLMSLIWLTEEHLPMTERLLAGSCVSYTNLGGAEPRLVAAAVSADWSAKRSWIWLVVERCRNEDQKVIG
jgi:hypothetical protein